MECIKTAGQEQRRHPRMHLQMGIHCVRLDPSGQNTLDQLSTFDISKSGIGATSDQPYYPGQRVMVRLPIARADGDRHMYARVVRCRRDREQGYQIGLEFEAASRGSVVEHRLVA